MGIIKGFTFDTIASILYNVGITGEAVYNAPERDVEMITIPGRNGELAFDRGRFHNIEVHYPAGAYDSSQPNFASKIRRLRNALCSRVGYCRLEDEYNPDEYRMAVYKKGLEVSPDHYSTAGEFDIVFDCKPQRFLKSGEYTQYTTQSSTMINNTDFNAYPLLEVTGYGDIAINDQHIIINNSTVGAVSLTDKTTSGGTNVASASYGAGILNDGDPIAMAAGTKTNIIIYAPAGTYIESFSPNPTGQDVEITYHIHDRANPIVVAQISFPELTFTAGTVQQYSTSISMVTRYTKPDQTSHNITSVIAFSVAYVPQNRVFRTTVSQTTGAVVQLGAVTQEATTGDSSVSTLGNPTYIDCEIGEAYNLANGEIVPVNNSVNIGSELPYLAPGTNNITIPSTVTRLGIKPRWWRI